MTTMLDTRPTEGKQYTRLLLGVSSPLRLGKRLDNRISGARKLVYLVRHEWRCASFWYWSLGTCAFDDESRDFRTTFLKKPMDLAQVFETSPLTNAQWWDIMDLYKQAYIIRDAAAVYDCGGNLQVRGYDNTTRCIQSTTAAKEINADLEVVLETAWDILQRIQWVADLEHRVNQAILRMGE